MGIRAIVLAAGIFLVSPAAAFAGATRHGARHAVIHAVTEEGDTVVEPHGVARATCRRTRPRHFYCWFENLTIGRKGNARVVYAHHRYEVGPMRYEPRPYIPNCDPPPGIACLS